MSGPECTELKLSELKIDSAGDEEKGGLKAP